MQKHKAKAKKVLKFIKHNKKNLILSILACIFVLFGLIALWVSTFRMPDLQSFDARVITQSTKIYDRTGKILLYDIHDDQKRKIIPFEDISANIKNATVAIEDTTFYQHGGIRLSSIFRSILVNIFSGSFSQGGSTITQQVVKNSILTKEKTLTRKLKEWVLSIELEKMMTKDQILSIYLNENPYGGSVYGVEEASQTFFGKSASDVDLAEAAYIAAIPKAPTFYSPYGQNKDKLDERQKLVLSRMLESKFINQAEYDVAINEQVTFLDKAVYGILAPHFVEFIREYMVNKYGEETLHTNGYKVITTLDYSLQYKSEDIVKKYALSNEKNFNAENASMVAIDPKTGQILAMVGSRDYFDKTIDGNFNIALAHRQPGSTFKPFVYATAFEKGYTPDTVLFDLPTEFQTTCDVYGNPINPKSTDPCYMPQDFDGLYRGPISLRSSLALSLNIPSIMLLYLAGMKDSLNTAKSMGIKSLSNDPNQYGLTLVLGGGEVSLLDLTSAYGVFANDGVRNPYTGILSVEDSSGNVLENFTPTPQQVIPANVAETLSDVMSDNVAKFPEYGANSVFTFPGRLVASKTGTTNNSKDAWTMGYTPEIVIGTWAGNNDNTPMVKKVAGLIVAPMWRELMDFALKNNTKGETFVKETPYDPSIKPALRGIWQGNDTYVIDKISGKLATALTPDETKQEVAIPNIHSILYWVDKSDPLGPAPTNPSDDPQFNLWEYPIQQWLVTHPQPTPVRPIDYDDVHIDANKPIINVMSPDQNITYDKDSRIIVAFTASAHYPIQKANFYLNDELIGTVGAAPFTLNFVPSSVDSLLSDGNTLKIDVYDTAYNKGEVSIPIKISGDVSATNL